MKNQKNLFLCWSYYHILVAVIKTMKMEDNVKTDIVLVNKDNVLDMDMEQTLINSKLFECVYCWDKADLCLDPKRSSIKYFYQRLLGLKRKYRSEFPVKVKGYENIYLFVDFDSVAAYLEVEKCKYHLIEDAKRVFSKESLKRLPASRRIKDIYPKGLHKFLHKTGYFFPIYGNSKYCMDISVESYDDLIMTDQNKGKFVLTQEKDLFRDIDTEKIKILFQIFGMPMDMESEKPIIVVLTEPLFADKRVDSIEAQLDCYKRILSQYCAENHVIIKPHPRDHCSYKGLENKEVSVVPKTFPSELFTLMPNDKIEKYITIASSSVFSYPPDKQLFLGDGFIVDGKK